MNFVVQELFITSKFNYLLFLLLKSILINEVVILIVAKENDKKVDLSKLFNDNFKEFYRDFKNSDDITFFIHKGGRNSAKSTHIALALVLDIIKNPVTTIVAKRYSNSLEKTVIEQIQWAINELGVQDYFKQNKSDRFFTYLPRGNKIAFIGADDPDRIKGIKSAKFPIARLWIDELAQFKSEDELNNLKNSILRDKLPVGLKYKMVYSYNPPKRKHNWVNKLYESSLLPKSYKVYHSNYTQNPHVADEFRIEAEHIKNTNPRRYDHEYMGLPIGNGIVPFDNLEFREITDEEIMRFDNIRNGNDFGYSVDANAFVRLHYDKTRKKIYIFGEIYEIKLSNSELVDKIKEKGWNDVFTIADSEDPKSIDECKRLGLKMVGARKGKGSVEYGEKWLDDLEAIIIDPKRCPNTAREFENIDYATDKDGNVLPKLIEKDDHTIASCRYALENDMQNRQNGLRGVPITR